MHRLIFRQFPHLSVLLGPQLKFLPFIVLLGLAAAILEGFGIGLVVPMLGVIIGDGGGGLGGFGAGLQDLARA